MQHQESEETKAKMIWCSKKVLLLIKSTQKAVNKAVRVLYKTTTNTEIKHNLLHWYKVKFKWKTYFFK